MNGIRAYHVVTSGPSFSTSYSPVKRFHSLRVYLQMDLPQHKTVYDMTNVFTELAHGHQWAYVGHLLDMAEGRKGPAAGHLSPCRLLPRATFDVVAVFRASILHSATVYHVLQTQVAKAATAAQVLVMLEEAVAAGSSKHVQYLRALPRASDITRKEVADLCFAALTLQLGSTTDTLPQLDGLRDPRLIYELTRLPRAAQISAKQVGQLLQLSVIPGGYLDVEALASLPAAARVQADVVASMKADAAATSDLILQRAVQEFGDFWEQHGTVCESDVDSADDYYPMQE